MKIPFQYIQIYTSIEEEIKKLSYMISFDESLKQTYSTYIGELELRVFTLMESVLKYRTAEMSEKSKYEDRFDSLYPDKTNIPNICIILNGYNLEKHIYTDILIKKENRITQITDGKPVKINKQNEKYNNAYQNLRHSFINSLPIFGTIEYLFEALAVAYLALDTPNLTQIFSIYSENEDGSKSVWAPSKNTIRIKYDS